MKPRILLASLTLILAPLAKADPPIGVNALHEKIPELPGKDLAVTGLVDKVSAARGMVVLIDSSEATCKDACERKTLVVLLPEGAEAPDKGTFLTATGLLVPDTNPPQLQAARVAPAR